MLNPAAAVERAAADFAATGVAQLRDFLAPAFAGQLLQELAQWPDWNLVFRDRGQHRDLLPEHYRALDARLRAELLARINAAAATDFQYFYYNVPLWDRLEAGVALPPAQAALCALLRGQAFLDAVRRVTGEGGIAFADFQLTKYVPGSFLSTHDDEVAGKNRVAAYVISLTPGWKAEWGGLLQLLDAGGEVQRTLVPAFNTLNVFRVPRPHCVSYVAPFAQGTRLSVTGWLRTA